MEHVSTLCAFGTVGVAAVGLALGCPESQPQASPLPTRRRRRSIFRGGHPLSQSVDLSAHNPSRSSTFEPSLYQQNPNDGFTSYSAFRKFESDTPSLSFRTGNENLPLPNTQTRPRRRTYVGPALRRLDDPCDDDKRPPTPQRPSTSWMRRLSTITSSLHDSSGSGSCPQSPLIQSATTPLFPSHNVPQTPNKLVKRPTSQRGFYHSHSRSYSGMPPTPTVLRRPATSHQRSAAMRQRSSTDSGMLLGTPDLSRGPAPVEDTKKGPPPSSDSWRPFFGFGRPRPDKSSGRRTPSARQRNRSPRRLVPEPGHYPTLLLATSVAMEPAYREESVRESDATTMARPVSCCSTEAGHPTRDAQTFASTKGDRHNLFSVEERIAGTPPSQFRAASKMRRERGLSLSRDQQTLQTADGFSRSRKEDFHSNVLSQQQHALAPESSSFSRPKTSPMAEVELEHRGKKQAGNGDIPRSSLRRVPNFSALRSGSQVPTHSGFPSRPGSVQSPSEQQPGSRVSSGSSASIMGRGKHLRHSAAGSDPSSTLTGSDVDARIFTSGDEDDTDFQSDTAFDSFSTRAAGSSGSGRRGPPIETIFRNPLEENRSVLGSGKVNAALPRVPDTGSRSGILEGQARRTHAGIPENDDNLSVTWSVSTDSGEFADRGESTDRMTPLLFGSQVDSRPCSWGDSEFQDPTVPIALSATLKQPQSPGNLGGRCEVDTQKSLFDWSEQQHNSRDGRSSDVRPRTANGKQLLLDPRGGRSSSRGPPSSLHLRSQSVPLSRELSMSKESLKSSKFATWGLGSKGVTEDWDGDFEFDDSDHPDQPGSGDNGFSESVVQTVKVPKSIMERQESLHGQFGHVQELTVLVEELKRLRIRAKALQIIEGPSSELWKEALGIVNLATSDEEEEADGQMPSFTEQPTSSPSTALDDLDLEWSFENAQSKLTSHLSSYNKRQLLKERINPGISTMPPLRTDPSARARIVLDSLHQDRDPNNAATPDPRQKLPFDTQSLRDLVIRAGVVTRALKEVVRRAEGVYDIHDHNSPAPDPPFRKIFSPLPDDSHESKQPEMRPS